MASAHTLLVCNGVENIRLLMQRNNLERAVYAGDTQPGFPCVTQAGASFIWASCGFRHAAAMRIKRFPNLPSME